jgi:hypothetical protein
MITVMFEEEEGAGRSAKWFPLPSFSFSFIWQVIVCLTCQSVSTITATQSKKKLPSPCHGEWEPTIQAQELAGLSGDGIPIKINHHSGLMHLKVTIADDKVVTTSSYNYTDEATYKNDEVLVIIRDPGVAKDWESEFERMWGDTADYESY